MKQYTKDIKETPEIPFQGLTIDAPMEGGFMKAKNVYFVNGWAYRRKPYYPIDIGETILASRGYKNIFEYVYSDGSKYIFVDVDYDATGTDKLKVISAVNNSVGRNIVISAWTTSLTGLTTGSNVIPMYGVGMNLAVRVDGMNDNKIFKEKGGVLTVENCGVAAPTVTPTLSAQSSGSITTDNDYQVYYTYVKITGTGSTLYEIESPPSTVSATLSLASPNQTIRVTYTHPTDTDVTKIRFYRNLAGVTTNYFKAIADVTANPGSGSTTVDLIKSDDDINAETTLDTTNGVPPKSKYVGFAAGRMWYLNNVSAVKGNSKLSYSNDSEPENVPSLNFILFDPWDGDELTGMGFLRDSILIFKRHKTWNVSLFYPFNKDVVSTNIGCIDSRTIAKGGSENTIYWLSAEGVIVYDGGKMTNISVNKINTIINNFIGNNADFTGFYDPRRHQYHLVMFYRDSTDLKISDHRHFVYTIQGGSNTWSEYEYKDSDGNIVYSTTIGSATNYNGEEVVLACHVEEDSVTADLIQMYNEVKDLITPSVFMYDSPFWYTTADANEIIYAANSYDGALKSAVDNEPVYRISSAETGAVYVSISDIQDLLLYFIGAPNPGDATSICYKIMGVKYDTVSLLLYILVFATGQDGTNLSVLTYDGTDLTQDNIVDCSLYDNALAELLIFNDEPLVNYNIYPDDSGIDIDSTTGATNVAQMGATTSYDGTYYYIPVKLNETWDKSGTSYALYKYDVDGFVESVFPASTSKYSYLQTYSDTKHYLLFGNKLYVNDYANGAWTLSAVSLKDDSIFSSVKILTRDKDDRMVIVVENTTDILNVYRFWDILPETDYLEDQWLSLGVNLGDYRYSLSSFDVGWVIGTVSTDKLYKVIETDFFDVLWKWLLSQLGDGTDLPYKGVVVELESVRTAFGAEHKQKIYKRVYFDTLSDKSTVGVFYIEGDSTNLEYLHSTDETSTPSGAISGGGFGSPGVREWKTEYLKDSGNMFDSEIDNRDTHKIHVGVRGSNYRWSLKLGDVIANNNGDWVMKPPRMIFVATNMKGAQEN